MPTGKTAYEHSLYPVQFTSFKNQLPSDFCQLPVALHWLQIMDFIFGPQFITVICIKVHPIKAWCYWHHQNKNAPTAIFQKCSFLFISFNILISLKTRQQNLVTLSKKQYKFGNDHILIYMFTFGNEIFLSRENMFSLEKQGPPHIWKIALHRTLARKTMRFMIMRYATHDT